MFLAQDPRQAEKRAVMAVPQQGSRVMMGKNGGGAALSDRNDAVSCWVLSLSDVFAIIAAFAGAAIIAAAINVWLMDRPYLDFIVANAWNRLGQYAPLAALLLLRFHIAGQYRLRSPFWAEMKEIVVGCGLALLADGFLLFATKGDFSRLWLVHSWALAVVLIPVCRGLARSMLDVWGAWRLPVVVIGDGEQAQDVCQAIASERWLGYDVVKTVPPPDEDDETVCRWIARLCRQEGARLAILALSNADMLKRQTLLVELMRERLPFAVIPPLRGLPILGFDQIYFVGFDVTMLQARNNLQQPLSRAVKLIFDIVVAAVLTVLLLPAFIAIYLAVIRDGGPALYRHTRIGRNGRPFTCLKFRTMTPGADRSLAAYLASDPAAAAEWERSYKLREDPRVTPTGRFLRLTSLDELPQLFNVLRGEMSLVGPRPVTAEELRFYGRDVVFYLETRPGMTGLWQVRGRSDTSYEARVAYDIWYVKNWSLWHDAVILAKTPPVVLRRVGAQ